jgi:hypothetical protein
MEQNVIQTMAGVMDAGDPAGTVAVVRQDGSTMLDLTVTDHTGTQAQVYLDYDQAVTLMIQLGAVAAEL